MQLRRTMVDNFFEEREAIIPLPKEGVLIGTVLEKVIFGNRVETHFLVDENQSKRPGCPKY